MKAETLKVCSVDTLRNVWESYDEFAQTWHTKAKGYALERHEWAGVPSGHDARQYVIDMISSGSTRSVESMERMMLEYERNVSIAEDYQPQWHNDVAGAFPNVPA